MTSRSRRWLVLVVAVALAFLVGSTVAASATALTARSVRQIATKVVNAKAHKLTVANSQLLGGQPPAVFQNPVHTYVVTQALDVAAKDWTLTGLPAGTYVASWSVFVSTSAATPVVHCQLYASQASTLAEGYAYGAKGPANYESVTSSAPVTVGPTAPHLSCTVDAGTFHTYGGDYPSRITFTKVDTLSEATVS